MISNLALLLIFFRVTERQVCSLQSEFFFVFYFLQQLRLLLRAAQIQFKQLHVVSGRRFFSFIFFFLQQLRFPLRSAQNQLNFKQLYVASSRRFFFFVFYFLQQLRLLRTAQNQFKQLYVVSSHRFFLRLLPPATSSSTNSTKPI